MNSRRYLFVCRGKAAILDVPSLEAVEWEWLQNDFAKACYPRSDVVVSAFSMYPDQFLEGGVYYDEELAGPGGMSFVVFPLPYVKPGALKKAQQWLRAERDVVRMKVYPRLNWLKPNTVNYQVDLHESNN